MDALEDYYLLTRALPIWRWESELRPRAESNQDNNDKDGKSKYPLYLPYLQRYEFQLHRCPVRVYHIPLHAAKYHILQLQIILEDLTARAEKEPNSDDENQ